VRELSETCFRIAAPSKSVILKMVRKLESKWMKPADSVSRSSARNYRYHGAWREAALMATPTKTLCKLLAGESGVSHSSCPRAARKGRIRPTVFCCLGTPASWHAEMSVAQNLDLDMTYSLVGYLNS
jgi:hypothetical protein